MCHANWNIYIVSNDNPPLPDNMTDKDKVLSHGFDLKTSFRKCKQD